MISALKGLSLPITQKLIPRRENLVYLAESAVLTRLAIAGMRTWQNAPSKNKNPDQSTLEKYNSLWERFFVEILGTAGYMTFMHLGQDLMAKVLESRKSLNPTELLKQLENSKTIQGMTPDQRAKILPELSKALEKVFGTSSQNIVSKVLYENANLASFWKTLDHPELLNTPEFRGIVEKFASQLNRCGSLTLLSGIGAGVLFGGVIVQWMNDRFIGPVVEPFLAQVFGFGEAPLYANTLPHAKSDFTRTSPEVHPNLSRFTEAQRTFRC